MNMLLSFSPVHISNGNKMEIVSEEPDTRDTETEYLILPPKTNGFLHCRLTKRYRNSQALQRFSLDVAESLQGKYANTNEQQAVDVKGSLPIWYDAGAGDGQKTIENLEKALKKVDIELGKKRIPGEEIVVLIDKDNFDEFKPICKKVLVTKNHSRDKTIKLLDERQYHGMESSTIVYVGSGTKIIYI